MAVPPPLWYAQDALDARIAFVGYRGQVSTLLSQVPRGRHDPSKLCQLTRVPFPRTSGPEPVVLPGLHAVVSTGDDTPFKTLEVIRFVTVGGVLD